MDLATVNVIGALACSVVQKRGKGGGALVGETTHGDHTNNVWGRFICPPSQSWDVDISSASSGNMFKVGQRIAQVYWAENVPKHPTIRHAPTVAQIPGASTFFCPPSYHSSFCMFANASETESAELPLILQSSHVDVFSSLLSSLALVLFPCFRHLPHILLKGRRASDEQRRR